MTISNALTEIILSVSFIFSGRANAASGNSTGNITTLHWYEGHTGVLIKQEGMSDLDGCGREDYYILDNQHPFL
ncbi:hypothetical protein ACPV54_10740 [Vibrio mediterranei]